MTRLTGNSCGRSCLSTVSHRTYANVILAFHTRTNAQVSIQGKTTPPSEISHGLRQGCTLAPTLFNIFFNHMILATMKSAPGDIYLRYNIANKQLFRTRYTQKAPGWKSTTPCTQTMPQSSPINPKCSNTSWPSSARWPGLGDRNKQAEDRSIVPQATHTNNLPHPPCHPNTPGSVNGGSLNRVSNFRYLGSTMSQSSSHGDITHRINRAAEIYGHFRSVKYGKIGSSHAGRNVKLYNAIIIPTVLYSAETLATCARERLETSI